MKFIITLHVRRGYRVELVKTEVMNFILHEADERGSPPGQPFSDGALESGLARLCGPRGGSRMRTDRIIPDSEKRADACVDQDRHMALFAVRLFGCGMA
jgi:hypothetical protein